MREHGHRARQLTNMAGGYWIDLETEVWQQHECKRCQNDSAQKTVPRDCSRAGRREEGVSLRHDAVTTGCSRRGQGPVNVPSRGNDPGSPQLYFDAEYAKHSTVDDTGARHSFHFGTAHAA
jgi:hypothetical protein